MDFDDTPEEAEFRAEARAFLDANASARAGRGRCSGWAISAPMAVTQCKAWQAKKADAGYAGITWPKEWGGRGASPSSR